MTDDLNFVQRARREKLDALAMTEDTAPRSPAITMLHIAPLFMADVTATA